MFYNLVAVLLISGWGLVAGLPQGEVDAIVRQTRQVLPGGAYPGGYPLGAAGLGPLGGPLVRPGGPIGSGPEGHAAIVGQVQEGPDPEGNFHYAFETENGISTQVSGALSNIGTPVEGQAMRGSYSYTSPEGIPITVNWYADETGFHAEGPHLPRQPVVPTGPEDPINIGGGIRPIPYGPNSIPFASSVPGLVR